MSLKDRVTISSSPPPIGGMLVRGERGLDVGDRVRVELAEVDVDRGFIDFDRAWTRRC